MGPDWSFEHDVLVVAGTGGAATIDRLLERGVRRIIAYHASDSAHSVDSRVVTVRAMPELWAALMDLDPPPRTVILRRLPGGGVSRELNQELADSLRKWAVNRATFARMGTAWVRHSLCNMRHLAERPSVATLAGAFRNQPCVIVSPGPSLSKNIDVLHQLVGRAVIIAGNRSVAPLKRAGIAPDLVVVADPLDLRYQLEGGMLEGAGALLLDLVVHPGMFQLEAQRLFTYTAVHEVFNSTFDAMGLGGLVPSGGSVATTAFRMAIDLGCNPVLFVGQDLALSGDKYYIETAPDGATRIDLKEGIGIFENSSERLMDAVRELGSNQESRKSAQSFVQVPGWDGKPVFTSVQFDNYRRWIESAVAALDPPVRVLNCTEGGAFIKATEHMTLAHAITQLAPNRVDVKGVLDGVFARYDARKVKKQLERQVTRMQLALNEALSEVSRCEALVGQLRTKPVAFKNLDKSEKKLRAALARAPFVTAWASADVEVAQRVTANAKSLEDTVTASRALYSIVRSSALSARPILSDTLHYVRRTGS